eukprot:12922868-Prorocentrum_lima.AAC.1
MRPTQEANAPRAPRRRGDKRRVTPREDANNLENPEQHANALKDLLVQEEVPQVHAVVRLSR